MMFSSESNAARASNSASSLNGAKNRIVVGMDGTKGSAAALRWALEEAQLRGVEVRAVMAWHQPVAIGASSGMSYSLGVDPAIATQFVLSAAVEAEVEKSRAKLDEGFDVVVACETLEGDPGATLVRAAEGAALLVVGTREHGGFVGAILGSVSHHVVAHATCPVVVVADPSRTRSANTESRLAGQGRAGIPPWHRSS